MDALVLRAHGLAARGRPPFAHFGSVDRRANRFGEVLSLFFVGVILLFLKDPGMDVKNLAEVPAFITKDGSEIRELLAYRNSVIRNQSLAEARLPAGAATQEHYHAKTEEIYFITHGAGRMRIDDEVREVKAGDAVAISPGKKHKLWNTGTEPLRLLCCCAPCYEHSDTFLTE